MLHKWIWIKASKNYFKSVSDFWAIGKKLPMILPLPVSWIMMKMLVQCWRKFNQGYVKVKEGKVIMVILLGLTLGSKFTMDARKQPLEVIICNHLNLYWIQEISLSFHALISHAVTCIRFCLQACKVITRKLEMVKGGINFTAKEKTENLENVTQDWIWSVFLSKIVKIT